MVIVTIAKYKLKSVYGYCLTENFQMWVSQHTQSLKYVVFLVKP